MVKMKITKFNQCLHVFMPGKENIQKVYNLIFCIKTLEGKKSEKKSIREKRSGQDYKKEKLSQIVASIPYIIISNHIKYHKII